MTVLTRTLEADEKDTDLEIEPMITARAIIIGEFTKEDKTEHRVLLLKRSTASKFGKKKYELPGGKSKKEDKETLEQLLEREVKEETGLDIELPEQEWHQNKRTMSGGKHEGRTHTTEVKVASPIKNPNVIISDEHSEYIWCSLREIEELKEEGLLAKTSYQALRDHFLN